MKPIIIALITVVFFSSCSQHFYAPALYNNDISYQPKPASFDTAKSATYVSIGEGEHDGTSFSNTITFGELDISRAHVYSNTNLSYGVFGFAGSIDNSNHQNELSDPHSFESKSFAGLGARASFNFFKVIGRANFRYIGAEAAYSKEYGDYAAYRVSVHNLPDYSATTRTEMFTLGATSEILWHSARATDRQYSFRLFMGKTFGDYSYLRNSGSTLTSDPVPLYITASYFMQIRHFFGVVEATRTIDPLTGLRIKLGYRF